MGILTRRRLVATLASLVVLPGSAALLATHPARAATEATLLVVVAPSSKVTNISMADLRRIFTTERLSDPQGDPFVPLNHPPRTTDRVAFDKKVLKMDAESVARFWIDRRIRGASSPPRTVDSLATLRLVVAKLPGAVAYLRSSDLSPEVRAVRVDGKLPSDPEYPLRY